MLSPPYSAYKIDTYSYSLAIYSTILTIVTITRLHIYIIIKEIRVALTTLASLLFDCQDSGCLAYISIIYHIFAEDRELPRSDFDEVIDDAELPWEGIEEDA
jgi:hypothetical protein